MSEYIAANGQVITEEMISRWCASYERGEFPTGEHTVGGVHVGRPPMSTDKTVTIGLKVPSGMRAALTAKAKEHGMTMSAYAREVLANDLMAVG